MLPGSPRLRRKKPNPESTWAQANKCPPGCQANPAARFLLICAASWSSLATLLPAGSQGRAGVLFVEGNVTINLRKSDKATILDLSGPLRSEERRVGKECRL